MFPSKTYNKPKSFGKKHRLPDKIREKYFLLFQKFQLVCIFKPSYNVENSAREKCRRVSARVAEALFLPVLLRGPDSSILIFKPGYNVENSARGRCRRVSARVAEALFLPVLPRGLEWFD